MVEVTLVRQDHLTASGQSWDYCNASDAYVKNVGKEIMWICRTLEQTKIKTKHNKTCPYLKEYIVHIQRSLQMITSCQMRFPF